MTTEHQATISGCAPQRAIAFLAGDIGGGKALLPVIRLCQSNGISTKLFGYLQAYSLWSEAGLEVGDGIIWMNQGFRYLDQFHLLVTATSVNSLSCEPAAWIAAREASNPSLAVLDYGNSLRRRFQHRDRMVCPSGVVATDSECANELREFLPAEVEVRICGYPQFDEPPPLLERSESTDSLRILFLSQPITEMVALDAPHPGYDEWQVLHDLLHLLAASHHDLGRQPQLTIRCHPRENRDKFGTVRTEHPWIRVSKSPHLLDDARDADLAVGMNSIALMDLAARGVPALSHQPNLCVRDTLPSNAIGSTLLSVNTAMLESNLAKAVHELDLGLKARKAIAIVNETASASANIFQFISDQLSLSHGKHRKGP